MTAAVDPAATWIRLSEVVQLGVAPRTAKRAVAEGRFQSRRDGGKRLVCLASLPVEVQRRYEGAQVPAALPAAEVDADEWRRRLGRFTPETRQALRAEADRRAGLLERYAALDPKWVRVDGKPVPSPGAVALFAEWPARDPRVLLAFPSWAKVPSERTVRAALVEYQAGGALRLVRAAPEKRSDDGRRAEISPALHRRLETLRYDLHPHATFASIYRKLRKEFGDEVPSRDTVRRYIARTWTKAQDVFEQKGPRTFHSTAQTHAIRDLDSVTTGEIYVGDHRVFDVEVINPARGGQLDRPWITSWIDAGSRAPVGWTIGFEPSSQTITEAFAIAVSPKADPLFKNLCGLPAVIHQDNGKDYRAAAVTTVFREYGLQVRQAIAYNPMTKLVERWHGTMAAQFDRDFPGYVGRNPTERTERVREAHKVHERWLRHEVAETPFITLAEFKRRFAAWVSEYMQQPHDELREPETGRSCTPAQRAAMRTLPIKLPDPRSLAMLAWPVVERTVRKGLLKVDRHFYYFAPELLRYEGQALELRRDPQDLRKGVAFAPDGTLIAVEAKPRLTYLRPGADGPIAQTQVREAVREERRELRELEQGRKARQARAAREARGETVLGEVLARTPVAPSEPPAPAAPKPAGAVHQLHPIDRVARAARAAEAAPVAPAPVPAVDEVLAEHIRAEGPRPVEEGEFDIQHHRLQTEQAEWDRLLALRRAARGAVNQQGG